ncbi:hypothetical protein D3C86_1939790 [compost metagenome]
MIRKLAERLAKPILSISLAMATPASSSCLRFSRTELVMRTGSENLSIHSSAAP